MTHIVGDDAASFPASPEAITELILRIFRVNGALLTAGDRLVERLGLTSARWQLLGAISQQKHPLSVAQLARTMGVTRQAVQRVANEMEANGMVAFRINPRHKRAQLIELTEDGRALFGRAMDVQRPWATLLGRRLSATQAIGVREALDTLVAGLESAEAVGL